MGFSNPTQTRLSDKHNPPNPNRISNTRHLTATEWDDRRKKGLCFKCGLKYSPQHKCTDGGLRILLLADGESIDENGEVLCAETLEDEAPEGECLSLESPDDTLGTPLSLSTIKLAGKIGEVPVLILVDSGATHNFLSKQLAISLGLTISPSRRTCIRMGDDRKVWMTEECKEVRITLGPYSFTTSALVYELGPLDMTWE